MQQESGGWIQLPPSYVLLTHRGHIRMNKESRKINQISQIMHEFDMRPALLSMDGWRDV